MDLQACTETLRTRVGESCGLDATLKFDCGADGTVLIDGRSVPNTVTNSNGDADCTVGLTLEDLSALLSGELDPMGGFMSGKLKLSGDMSVALKLRQVM